MMSLSLACLNISVSLIVVTTPEFIISNNTLPAPTDGNSGQDIIANRKGGDFYFINADTDEEICDQIRSLLGGRLEKFYKADSIKDMQVLSPMRKGTAGVKT